MSNQLLLLLPHPRRLTYQPGLFPLTDGKLIVLDSPLPQELWFSARRVQQALRQYAGVDWQTVAGGAVPTERVGLTFILWSGSLNRPQGYQLSITPQGIFLRADTAAGIFYGCLTLNQILQQSRGQLPLIDITDWPDFPNRGVMLDISRGKVPTLATLFNLFDLLASWKINQFQLYTEHTFAYQRHPEVWADASPLTGEEILALDAYCRERFVELVPNQNSFGHLRRWLVHDRYRHLAECPHGCDTGDPAWGHFAEPFSLCPGDPGSLELVRSMMDELLPHFSSRQFNVGCDETVDLGCGRSRELVAERGKGRVYLDFLLNIYREVKRRGCTMQFWGDIIIAYPELVAELPGDVIALEWGYEADHPFDQHGASFAASGIPFYVCPGTSSWNSIAGRTDNALANLRNAAQNGLKHGAVGYLITDWGDNGHWQPLPVSYLGLAYGAALAWAYQANQGQDMAQAVSVYAFGDASGRTGKVVHDLGNAYSQMDCHLPNNSILFRLLQESPAEIVGYAGLTETKLQKTHTYLDQVSLNLSQAQSHHPEAELVKRELDWAAEMLKHACRRGSWALGQQGTGLRRQLAQEADSLLTGFSELWLARNRPGELDDSQALLGKIRLDYEG